MSKGASLLRITVAYVVALLVALGWVLLGPDTGRLWLDVLIADVLATLVIFAFSRGYGNSSFYDAFWSVAPPLLLLFWWVEGGAADHYSRGWLVTVVVPGVFAVGDIAATDALRTSARNRADKLLARNVTAFLSGGQLQPYRPPRRRWGLVVGVQPDGYQIFSPSGRAFRFPPWAVDAVLWPWLVRRGIYRGVRSPVREG